ncbi:uncharacterized protein P884DRAFT_242331 [Thermothelomyces heterothallicus CBS 202.75]|uniref:uncharacterized protein n=1 Tax=Thermothelomyces heterothallicus CBS 202.75 TaxID=1149848 RepID=UPI0037435E72
MFFNRAPARPSHKRDSNIPVKTSYVSNRVALPPGFLTTAPPDARPATAKRIDFASSPLPEYAGRYAAVLDHVLSPSECAALLALAEASVPLSSGPGNNDAADNDDDPWHPALVNVGGGFEVLQPDYRNGDRIIWDCQEVVDRIWARCLAAAAAAAPAGGVEGDAGLLERVAAVEAGEVAIVGHNPRQRDGARWEFSRVNERMRFLRYEKGGFFKPHCDAPFVDARDPSRTFQTIFTIHLYLNDSDAEVKGAELVGGATTFYSSDGKRRIDVHPKAGRVLIFQHRRLLHSGDDVLRGTKYTMRTDIMYELKIPETRQ